MKRLLLLIAAGALTLGACGGDDGGGVRDVGGTGAGTGSGSASAVAECVPVGDAASADTTVAVTLKEFTIALDRKSAPAGKVHFAISNEGEENHEVVVVKGVSVADLPKNADGALDEAKLPTGALIGEVEAFPPGEKCDGTFELAAGEYVLVCNVVEEKSDGTHEAHVAEGMVIPFTVT